MMNLSRVYEKGSDDIGVIIEVFSPTHAYDSIIF